MSTNVQRGAAYVAITISLKSKGNAWVKARDDKVAIVNIAQAHIKIPFVSGCASVNGRLTLGTGSQAGEDALAVSVRALCEKGWIIPRASSSQQTDAYCRGVEWRAVAGLPSGAAGECGSLILSPANRSALTVSASQ